MIWFLSADAKLMELEQTYAAHVQPGSPDDISVVELSAYQALQTQADALAEALDKTLIKVDWNSDDFHPKQYAETRNIILDALASYRKFKERGA